MTDTTTISPNVSEQSRVRKTLTRAVQAVPSLIALAAILGVAAWGHFTGWSAPKFSQLTGEKKIVEEDWCAEHNVPDSRCIKCKPELVGANMNDWCPEHGVPESKCTICHPEILTTGVAGDWCPEHGLPESGCTLCHPEIAIKGTAPRSSTGATVSFVSTDGSVVGSTKDAVPITGASIVEQSQNASTTKPNAKDPKTCQSHNLRVQFASGDAVAKAGVELGQVVERPMSSTLKANAEVRYDKSRLAQLSSAVTGKVWRVERELGQNVNRGDVIALVDSAEVGRAKAELLQASATLDLNNKTLKRLRQSSESGLRTQVEVQEAEAAVTEAEIHLFNARQALINLGLIVGDTELSQKNIQFFGLPISLADTLDPKTTTANLIPIVAPFDGTIIELHSVVGEMVDSSKPLFVIADTSRMSVFADLPLADALRVSIGKPVRFFPDGMPENSVTGVVGWVSTSVDDQTRTAQVRADIDNTDARMLAHTFGTAVITIRDTTQVVAVPTEAIQWEGCCHVAFVRLTDDIFQTRKVKIGVAASGFTEIMAGLLPGEVIATRGSYVLKSEILKSALGAGCADH